jgi:hypothetical protein
MATWKVAEVKSRLSELIDRAMREGAQEITRHGRRAPWWSSRPRSGTARPDARKGWCSSSTDRPLQGSGLEVERLPDLASDVEL